MTDEGQPVQIRVVPERLAAAHKIVGDRLTSAFLNERVAFANMDCGVTVDDLDVYLHDATIVGVRQSADNYPEFRGRILGVAVALAMLCVEADRAHRATP